MTIKENPYAFSLRSKIFRKQILQNKKAEKRRRKCRRPNNFPDKDL